MSGLVLDLFAGPGGWDEGALPLGLRPVGVEWDMAACLTAMAAGHTRVRADISTLPTQPMVGKVEGLIASPPCQDFSLAGKQAGITGDKGRLITQVLRWTGDLRPRWVACEQVPPCLDLWREYAEVMRGWGYRTWVGILNAADYGVPQTRRRAILLASLDRQPTRPEPTHAKGGDIDLFSERAPWISMATALGWDQPVAYRRTRGPGMTERYGERRDHPSDEPAPTLTSKARSDEWVNGSQENAARRPVTEPARTVWMYSAGVTGEGRPKDAETQPADTITGKGTAYWAYDRPATTVVGPVCPDIIAAPGYRTDISRQNAPNSVRVTVQEAGILQSFRPDYPWQGSRTKQYEQCGNAVPPRLATHILAAVTGIALPTAIEAAA